MPRITVIPAILLILRHSRKLQLTEIARSRINTVPPLKGEVKMKWCKRYNCWCDDVEDIDEDVAVVCDLGCLGCDDCEEIKPKH